MAEQAISVTLGVELDKFMRFKPGALTSFEEKSVRENEETLNTAGSASEILVGKSTWCP